MTRIKESSETYWKDWKLKTSGGAQVWEFLLPTRLKQVIRTEADWEKPEGKEYLNKLADAFSSGPSPNPNSGDQVYRFNRKRETEDNAPKALPGDKGDDVEQALKNGFSFYQTLQTPDGNWPGDYGGPMFLLPGLIITAYITSTPFEKTFQVLMKQYMENHQNADGGWGLHIEGDSTLFGTVLQYVALRLLGEDPDQFHLIKARNWIKGHGGAMGLPPWGKFYLSVLGCYPWEGNDSLLPELWVLPRWLPIHPGKYWNHTRMVYLPMSYCYAKRVTSSETPVTKSLKEELFVESYNQIDWKKARKSVSPTDDYQPVSRLYRLFNLVGNLYEKRHIKYIRKKAIKFIIDYIDAEDQDTSYINVGPVNQVINSLCVWHRYGKQSAEFQNHVSRWKEYLWLAEDGLKMNGYNGSQLWDTAFAGQALIESGMANHFPDLASGVYQYLDRSQIRENSKSGNKFFRSPSKGSWPFSTSEQGWPTADCTAEALKTAIQLEVTNTMHISSQNMIHPSRLSDAVDYLLMMQNKDGGWASYEESRGPKWLEKLNPSRIFSDIMIEHSYTECTSATIQGLKHFQAIHPAYRNSDIQAAIQKGTGFIQKAQRADGSWYGSWAVCFTYATWFGIESLVSVEGINGLDKRSKDSISKASEFLLKKQREDGSWGESYRSCVEKKYIEHEEGQIVNTSWALLALMAARHPDKHAIQKGIDFILSKQEKNGDWPQQGISGVFNGNCMITYTSYRNVFPLWALGRYFSQYVRVVD